MTSKKAKKIVPFQIGDRCIISFRGRFTGKSATITEIFSESRFEGEKAKVVLDSGETGEYFVGQLQRLDPYPKIDDRLVRMPYKKQPRISCTVVAIVNGEARAATGAEKLTEYNVSAHEWNQGLFIYEG